MSSEAEELMFCCELTGVDETSPRFIKSILKRARARFGSKPISALLETYRRGGLAAVFGDATHAGIARAILYGLYSGLLPDADGGNVLQDGPTALTADDHFQALIWRVIQAHPPALSGGYFGHWHYPPEDA